MKKLAFMFLLVGSLLIGANVVNAAGDGAKKNKAKTRYVSCSDQTNQIKALIGSPDIVLNATSKIEVNFNISEDNTISVNEIKTDNVELEKFVFEKMNGQKIEGNQIEMKNQTLSLVFKTGQSDVFSVY
jgi:hypothetical protein